MQAGAGESLEGLYKLFRQKKPPLPKAAGGLGGNLAGSGGLGGKKRLGATGTLGGTGGDVMSRLRAGSVIGGRLGGLLGTLPGSSILGGVAEEKQRSGSRDGTTPGPATRKRRGKDGDDDIGDGTMNPYPSDLLAQLQSLYVTHVATVAAGPSTALLEDVRYLELDARDKPESLDGELWEALLQRRAGWIDKEREVRRASYRMHEMALHLAHLHEMATALAAEVRSLTAYRANLLEARSLFALNTEVLLHVQQGCVEIAESPVVSDLAECNMIDRSSVEALNAVIQKAGAEKVDILRDTTVSRTAINLLEWTRAKLALEHADSVDLTTELQLLRVTKSLQSLIKMGGHDNQKAAELKALDRKMEFVAAASRDALLGKKLRLLKVRKKIKQQTRENERLYETVQELEAAVKERMQISSIRDEGRLEETRAGAERMKALVTRRKLVDLAKLQSEEIKFLRNEVGQLRQRTFASFAIPNMPQHHNPDERIATMQHSAAAASAAAAGGGKSYAQGRTGAHSAGYGSSSKLPAAASSPAAAAAARPFDPSRTLPPNASPAKANVPHLPPVQRAGSAGNSSR